MGNVWNITSTKEGINLPWGSSSRRLVVLEILWGKNKAISSLKRSIKLSQENNWYKIAIIQPINWIKMEDSIKKSIIRKIEIKIKFKIIISSIVNKRKALKIITVKKAMVVVINLHLPTIIIIKNLCLGKEIIRNFSLDRLK